MWLSTHIIVPLCAENGETGAGAVGQLHAFYAEGYLFPRSLANDLADDVLCQLRRIANSCCVGGGGSILESCREGALEGQATAPMAP